MKKAPNVLLRIRVKIAVHGKLQFRYVEPVYLPRKGKNAKAKLNPLVAKIGDEEQHHPEGAYALRYSRKWENVGTDAEEALCALERKKNCWPRKRWELTYSKTVCQHLWRMPCSGQWLWRSSLDCSRHTE